jgi:Fic family protein
MLSFDLSPELISKLKALDNAFVSAYLILKNLPEEELTAIHRYARISNIGSSTRIENAQLTDSEINWIDTILTSDAKIHTFEKNKKLIENKLSKDRERSIEEVAGCRQMLMLIYHDPKAFDPLREMDIRALHHELMAPYQKNKTYIGRYKIQPNFVVEKNQQTGESRIVFQTADAGPVTQAAMSDLVSWYNEAKQKQGWHVAAVCEFIYRFLAIHPFQDGNGRLGRGLFLLALLQADNQAMAFVTPCLSVDRNIEKFKEEYYFVLNRCSKGKFSLDPKKYAIEYFVNFMIKILNQSLADIEVYRKKYQAIKTLSQAGEKILACFKEYPEIRMTTQKLMDETQLPRRTISNVLARLQKNNLIQKYGQGAGTQYQIAV